MDHGYIDRNSVAESYLKHTLARGELRDFEAHLVDCEECRDRVLLAEMFHARNGVPKPAVTCAPLPDRAKLVAKLRPWQIWVILAGAAALLVLIPAAGMLLLK